MRPLALVAVGLLVSGCAASRPFTPRTVDCGQQTPVPNPSGRIELASLGVSIVPPQASGWCMSAVGADFFAFRTHRLMGRHLESLPSQAEQAHTMGLLVAAGPPPKDAPSETPEELAAFARRLMLGDSGRFRVLGSQAAPEPFRGADCIRFDSVVEERDNPRSPGVVLQIVNRENYLCRHPHASPPKLILFGASERYIQGTVRPPFLLDSLQAQWEASIRSVEFLRPR
jgi:hypothetical protein